MNVPSHRIKVATDIPYGDDDQWVFSFVVFYAHDSQVVPPGDWNHRNYNAWFMLVHESNKFTGQMRVIHIAPEYTTDGRVKGVHVMLRPASDPEVPKYTVQHYKMEEWALNWNNLCLYLMYFCWFQSHKQSTAATVGRSMI
ncbi:hypothetical protein RSAG8_02435, partial [Rhizoctonia solani AG-8 WAC10335]